MSPPGPRERTAPDGLVVVDKPAGMTSHDVVARVRRILGTRKVGHAGTLDPMATGVLVLGVERATRLLGHLQLQDKEYEATMRLGVSTVTDDAEGDVLAVVDASHVTDAALLAGVAALTGDIEQRPTAVSAVKVDGRRAYARVRAGEDVVLAARPVTVREFVVRGLRRLDVDGVTVLDVEATVACTSGTYVRALARDLGAGLGVGGHLTRLRRTRVGPYDLSVAADLDTLAEAPVVVPLAEAVAQSYPRLEVAPEDVRAVLNGGRLPAPAWVGDGPVGVYAPDGAVLSLAERRGELLVPLVVFS